MQDESASNGEVLTCGRKSGRDGIANIKGKNTVKKMAKRK